jgi:parallel beta-helix repeat protein
MKIKEKISSGMGGAIAILFLIALAFISCGTASAPTIYVPDNYAKIQWAVDNASEGDTIIVSDGTYTENVDVNKRLTIRSENGSANCIVDAANPGDHVFEVTANYVNISGFTITNATEFQQAGIYIDSVGHCKVSDNNVSKNNFSIRLDNSSYNTLQNNTASNNNVGIHLTSSSSNTITNNNASTNERTNIVLRSSSSNNTLTNNTASYGVTGIFLIEDSNNNTLTNNTASNNIFGIYLWTSSGNNLTGNIANSNTGERGSISLLWGSNDNTLMRNNASNNSQYGIYLESSSSNTLTSNTINSNSDYGLYIDDSNNNLIYNNYFNNTNNAYDDRTSNVWNVTNTPGPNIVGGPSIGGNYWSDYTGIDNNSNGFGDTAYNLTGGTNKDYLPLVPMCGDLDCNCIVNILDVRLLLNHVADPNGYQVEQWAGNVDGEGNIDGVDVQLLLEHVFDPAGHPLQCS